jgi:L-amino acid N-acyltransferase YncA/uncharacterized damage-inducible protein DinB
LLNFRHANPTDAAVIAEIYSAGIAEGVATFETSARNEEDILPWFERSMPTVVVTEGDVVIAFACAFPYSDRCAYTSIAEFSVYVHPKHRRKGAASLAMKSLIDASSEAGITKLTSRVISRNLPSLALMSALGFTTVGTHKNHGKLGEEWCDVVTVEYLIGSKPISPSGVSIANALLDSWDRQCRIVEAVASRVNESNRHLKPSEDGWQLDFQLAHIHKVRHFFLENIAPRRAALVGDSMTDGWETSISDLSRIKTLLTESAVAVRDVMQAALSDNLNKIGWYDNVVLYLQHMVWHEGWHVGLILLALRLDGQAPPQEWEEEKVWNEWRTEEW